MPKLEQGIKLKGVHVYFREKEWHVEVGKRGCKSITVSMENGQHAGVPWAHVVFEDGLTILVNLAQVDAVTLEDDNG